jgi:hypothetical protein
MPLPSEHRRRAREPTTPSPVAHVASLPNTMAALATALALAAGALLERPDGASPWPTLGLFALAVTLALGARALGARAPSDFAGQ